MKTSQISKIAGLSILTAAALTLTACGGPTVDGGGNTNTNTSGNPYEGVEPATEISFWSNHPGGSIELEKELIEKFTAETGITVDHVTAGANYEEVAQRFQTSQVSGDAGDLVVLSDANWFTQYLTENIVSNDLILEALAEDTSTYVEALYNDYLYEGEHYAVPYARSTPLFYYNVDHYEAAGITEAPKTWDDVAANARTIAEAGVAEIGFGFPQEADYPAWTMANLVWAFGGAWSDEWDLAPLNGEKTVEALTFAQDLVNEGVAAVLSSDPATAFSAGAASQVIASTGSLRGITDTADFEFAAAFLPGGPSGETNLVPTGGAGLAISASSTPEKQVAAAMLASFMTNATNTAFFSEGTGYVPVRTDADMSSYFVENPKFEVAVEQLSRTRSQDFARVFIPGGDRVLAQSLQRILASGADVQETLDSARGEIQTAYDRDLEPVIGAN